LFPGTAVKDGGLYSVRRTLSIRQAEQVEIEIAIGIAIEISCSTIPNPISIAISRRPTLSHYYSVLRHSYAVTPAKAGIQVQIKLQVIAIMQEIHFDWLVGRVAMLLTMDVEDVLKAGRYPQTVKARSILLYWAHRELGIPTTELARRMNLSQPAVSHSVARGERLVREYGYTMSPDLKL
jgi:hypothetical protein